MKETKKQNVPNGQTRSGTQNTQGGRKRAERKHHIPSEASSPFVSEGSSRGGNVPPHRTSEGEGSKKAKTPHRRESVILLRALIAFVSIAGTFLLVRMLLLLIPIASITVSYEEGTMGYLTMLFSSRSIGDFLTSLERMTNMLTYDKRTMGQINSEKAVLSS